MELIFFIFIIFDKFSHKITNQNSRVISFFCTKIRTNFICFFINPKIDNSYKSKYNNTDEIFMKSPRQQKKKKKETTRKTYTRNKASAIDSILGK